jgi:ubiquitin-like-conjugating enzyme ATG3
MDGLSHSLGEFYRSIAGTFISPASTSTFRETGKLTPDEFILAGNQLVSRFPTWTWQPSTPGNEQAYLPPDRQFLATRGVPCRRRAKRNLEHDLIEQEVEDGWVLTDSQDVNPEVVELVPDFKPQAADDEDTPHIDDIGDDSYDAEEVDPNALPKSLRGSYFVGEIEEEAVLRTRVYDLSVTYDKYYQTPRLWLSGYDEISQPLTASQMFEDIMDDYANKTVTIDPHPCLGNQQLSVHPCNHAKMMKQFVDIIECSGGVADPRLYLFVFLKFLASVVPTIEYDFMSDFALE